jgi:hypothetical protein
VKFGNTPEKSCQEIFVERRSAIWNVPLRTSGPARPEALATRQNITVAIWVAMVLGGEKQGNFNAGG